MSAQQLNRRTFKAKVDLLHPITQDALMIDAFDWAPIGCTSTRRVIDCHLFKKNRMRSPKTPKVPNRSMLSRCNNANLTSASQEAINHRFMQDFFTNGAQKKNRKTQSKSEFLISAKFSGCKIECDSSKCFHMEVTFGIANFSEWCNKCWCTGRHQF